MHSALFFISYSFSKIERKDCKMKKKGIAAAIITGLIAYSMAVMLGLSGCGSQSAELQIFAANSLEKALPEVQKLYTEKNPDVTFAESQFKGSGELVEQIEAGATPDILITASKSTMDDAESASYIDSSSRKDMFKNDLVIVAAEDSDITISDLKDVAKIDGKIAIGEASAVPAGKYANQSLASVNLYSNAEGVDGKYASSISKKVVSADKVGTAAKWVSSGNCDIAFVYSSDVYRYDNIKVIYTVPADTHKDIIYPGAVCANAANSEAAAKFIDFCMTDPEAQQIWANYGFQLITE